MALSDSPVMVLAEHIRVRFGLNFAGARLDVLVDGLKQVNPDFNEAARQVLAFDRQRLADFVGRITNTETYFFRHTDHFEALKAMVPERLRPVPPPVFRVWSAGCSTGEEPLSLAATLLDMLPQAVTLSILATDINPTALAKATNARYTEWSFRGVTPEQRHRYFQLEGGFYRPREVLRQAVTFRRHNLLDGAPEPVPFDLVVCRNVLIYFEPDELAKAVNGLSLAVAPRGILVLGPTETAAAQLPEFEAIHQYGCIVHVKRDGLLRWTPTPAPAAPPAPATLHPFLGGSTSSSLSASLLPTAPTFVMPAPPPPVHTSLTPVPFAPPAPAAASSTPDPQALERARALADQGRLDDARAAVTAYMKVHGDVGEARLLLALIAMERGDRSAAASELEAAVARDDSLALAHYLLGTILEEADARTGAEQAYQHALMALHGASATDPVRASGGMQVHELVSTIDLALGRARKGAR